MKLVVGLGNPGPRYETTRHNAGFLVVDDLANRWSARGPTQKNQAQIFETERGGEKIILIKPQTFMNLSGRSVGEFYRFYKCEPSDLIVIHDDLDHPPISMRFKTGGGAGGHNGLKSLDECLGTNAYHRIRLGVGRPTHDAAEYVLQPFSDEELRTLETLFPDIEQAIDLIFKGHISQAMNRFHRKEEKA